MRELATLTNEDICAVIGNRLKIQRLREGLSQAAISEMTGIPLRTYKRFESTGKGRIETLVSTLRALERLRVLEVVLPPPALHPEKTLAAQVERLRKRARRTG